MQTWQLPATAALFKRSWRALAASALHFRIYL